LYLPEILNRANIGHYYENYRLQIFVFDLIISYLIFRQIVSLKIKPLNQLV